MNCPTCGKSMILKPFDIDGDRKEELYYCQKCGTLRTQCALSPSLSQNPIEERIGFDSHSSSLCPQIEAENLKSESPQKKETVRE